MDTKLQECFKKTLNEKQERVHFAWGDDNNAENASTVKIVRGEVPGGFFESKEIKETTNGKKIKPTDYIVFGWEVEFGEVYGCGETEDEALAGFHQYATDEVADLAREEPGAEEDYDYSVVAKMKKMSDVKKWLKKKSFDKGDDYSFAMLKMDKLPESFKQGYGL